MLVVIARERSRGVLRFDGREYPCALGRGGVRSTKREGDGATPVGTFPLRCAFYRPDRLARPSSKLPVRALDPHDGWCDAPEHAAYNRLVRLPFEASHEVMWRSDGLYDVVVVIGYNDDPPRPDRGSAIFVHCATAELTPTRGCIALARAALLELLPRLSPETAIQVGARPD